MTDRLKEHQSFPPPVTAGSCGGFWCFSHASFPRVFLSWEPQSVKPGIKDRCDANRSALSGVSHLYSLFHDACMLKRAAALCVGFMLDVRVKCVFQNSSSNCDVSAWCGNLSNKTKQIIKQNKESWCSWLVKSHSSLRRLNQNSGTTLGSQQITHISAA